MLFTKHALGADWSEEGLKLVVLGRRFRQLVVFDFLHVSAPFAKEDKTKIEEFLKRNHVAEARVVACLPRETFFIRFLDLPGEAESQLARVVGYQVDTLHPFHNTPIRWDSAVVAKDAKTKQIRVMIAIAEQSALDRQSQALKDLGIRPDSLTPAAAPVAGLLGSLLPEMALVVLSRGSKMELLGFRQGNLVAARELASDDANPAQQLERELHALGSVLPPEASKAIPTFTGSAIPEVFSEVLGETKRLPLLKLALSAPPKFDAEMMFPALAAACSGLRRRPSPSLNLLPLESRLRPSRWGRVPIYAAGASAALLGLTLLAHGLIETALYGRALDRQIHILRSQAETVQQQGEQATHLSERAALLESLRAQTWQKLQIMRELTNLLPDGTWIQDLQVGQGTVEFSGSSNRAADLIQPLENSVYFSRVEFASPITRGSDNKEVFRIRMRVGKTAVH